MASVVSAIVAAAAAHAVLAYALALLSAAAEALPVLGAAVPGTAIIIALGALVPSGALALWPLLLATTAGAVAGDGFSYWLGHHYRERTADIPLLRKRPELIAKGEAFFARHGGKAVLIARFTPGVRAVVPLVAGILGMPVIRFSIVNLVSAVAWAPAHVALGLLIGASFDVLGAIAGRLAALVFLLFAIVVIVAWAVPPLVRRVLRLAEPAVLCLRGWAMNGEGWAQRQLRSLLDPGGSEIRGLVLSGALLIGGFWLFFGVLQDVLAGDPLVRADRAVLHFFEALRTEWIDRMAAAVAAFGTAPVILAVAAAMLLWLVRQRAWRAALYELAAIAGAAAFAAGMRVIAPAGVLAPIRPTVLPPAWQMAEVTALSTFLAVLVAREGSARLAAGTALALVLVVVLLGLARLYLGVDWLSTILAGTAFGTAWAALLSLVHLLHRPRPLRPLGLLTAAGIAFVAAGGSAIKLAPPPKVWPAAATRPSAVMSFAAWRSGGWTGLPGRRIDIFGQRGAPLSLQWAGRLDGLAADLAGHGWRRPVPWTWRSALEWLSPKSAPTALPVLPHLEDGRPEALVMIKTGAPLRKHERIVLRVWPSGVALRQGRQVLPLWIGAATIERITPVSFLFTTAVEEKRVMPALKALQAALPAAAVVRRPGLAPYHGWNGTVLLGAASPQAGLDAAKGRR
jgi:membrane protein DedA with SNARE-associated domain